MGGKPSFSQQNRSKPLAVACGLGAIERSGVSAERGP